MITLADILTSRPDLAALIKQGIEAVIARQLEVERERDAARAAKSPIGDSRTTHASPSTDPRPKPRSQRRKTGRTTGGQPGHPGHRLEPVAKPDHTIVHAVTVCSQCRPDLSATPTADVIAKQVFGLQKLPLVVTEHRCESKRCPGCATTTTTTAAPAGAEQPTSMARVWQVSLSTCMSATSSRWNAPPTSSRS